MIRIWHRSRVSPPRKTWSARKSRKLGMVIGIALIDVIGVVLIGVIGAVSVAAIITDRGSTVLRPKSYPAAVLPSFRTIAVARFIEPFPGRNRRRPCRNSRSRPDDEW